MCNTISATLEIKLLALEMKKSLLNKNFTVFIGVSQVSKITLRFDDALKILKDPGKLFYSSLQFIIAKGYRLKSAKEKGA